MATSASFSRKHILFKATQRVILGSVGVHLTVAHHQASCLVRACFEDCSVWLVNIDKNGTKVVNTLYLVTNSRPFGILCALLMTQTRPLFLLFLDNSLMMFPGH